jgi:hypothetical protein
MRTFLTLANTRPRPLPPAWQADDVRYPDALPAHFVEAWTQPGDRVFDPFAGFGTTLIVAEALGRVPMGLEYDPERVAYIRTQLHDPAAIRHGDARRLAEYPIPPFALSVTSPPYMQRDDPEDPLAAYTAPGQGYVAYLQDLQAIYAQMRPLLLPGARVVIEVANLKGPGGVTSLAWDVARAVGGVLTFAGEIVVGWTPTYGYGYDHSYCLVFTRPEDSE